MFVFDNFAKWNSRLVLSFELSTLWSEMAKPFYYNNHYWLVMCFFACSFAKLLLPLWCFSELINWYFDFSFNLKGPPQIELEKISWAGTAPKYTAAKWMRMLGYDVPWGREWRKQLKEFTFHLRSLSLRRRRTQPPVISINGHYRRLSPSATQANDRSTLSEKFTIVAKITSLLKRYVKEESLSELFSR